MNFNEILAKKQARLSKHSGRKLRRKIKAYQKAVQRHAGGDTLAPPKAEVTNSKGEVIPTSQGLGELVKAKVQGKRNWIVTVPGKSTFTVQSTNEKDARAEARKVLGARALPNGTTVEHF
jgi:hypothetical protein